MVNRIGGQSPTLSKDEWAEVVADELKKEIDFKIEISSDANSVTISVESQKNSSGAYNYVICLAESNIINWQKDGSLNVENYEHNHVLRCVLADDNLSSSSTFLSGQLIEKTIEYNLADLQQFNIDYSSQTAEAGNGNAGNWTPENISIIAFIYNTNTNEILQVKEVDLNS